MRFSAPKKENFHSKTRIFDSNRNSLRLWPFFFVFEVTETIKKVAIADTKPFTHSLTSNFPECCDFFHSPKGRGFGCSRPSQCLGDFIETKKKILLDYSTFNFIQKIAHSALSVSVKNNGFYWQIADDSVLYEYLFLIFFSTDVYLSNGSKKCTVNRKTYETSSHTHATTYNLQPFSLALSHSV